MVAISNIFILCELATEIPFPRGWKRNHQPLVKAGWRGKTSSTADFQSIRRAPPGCAAAGRPIGRAPTTRTAAVRPGGARRVGRILRRGERRGRVPVRSKPKNQGDGERGPAFKHKPACQPVGASCLIDRTGRSLGTNDRALQILCKSGAEKESPGMGSPPKANTCSISQTFYIVSHQPLRNLHQNGNYSPAVTDRSSA